MQQWEYNKQQWIYQGEAQEISMLDSFGRLGWENYFKDGSLYYFKRPLPQPSPHDLFSPSQSKATEIFNDVKNEVEGGKKMPWKPSDTKD